METATLKHLKNCAKTDTISTNPKLKLHYKARLQHHQKIAMADICAQNEIQFINVGVKIRQIF